MEKSNKVKNITGNGTWESKYGMLFKFEVEFDNGDIGEYNSKSKDQNKFIIGQIANYDITSRESNGNTYYTIKPVSPQQPAYNAPKDLETSKKIARMSVLKCVTDLVIADHIKFDKLFEYAQLFEAYVEQGINPFDMMQSDNHNKTMQQGDALPF